MSDTAKDFLISKAISLFNEGLLKKSLKETIKARKKYPDEPFIYNLLGVLYAHIGSYEDSIKNYSRAIKLNPKYFEAFNNLGVVYTSLKKFSKAIECLDRAIQINPSYAEAYNNKGNALKERGDYKLAIEYYEKSIHLNPIFIDAISNAGIAYDILNDFERAKMYFNQALSLNPTNISLLYNLANCLYNGRNFKQAIEICHKIVSLDTSFYYAYNRIGLCYIKLGNIERAKDFFEKAIKIKPDYVEGLTNYGLILQEQKNYTFASVQFEKALTINPDSDEALINLSKAYFDEGRLSKAIEVAKKGLSLKQTNIPLIKNLVASLLLLSRFDEASVECKKMLQLNENDADAINLMGTIFEKQGLYVEAKEKFLRALELDPNLLQAKLNIATLYQLDGNFEKANELYNDIENAKSDNPEVNYRKSAFALKQENFEDGWRYYENRWKVFPLNKVKWPCQGRPVWKGEKGKRVVLWKEQGVGDQIICLSLAPEVKRLCGDLSIYIDPRLQSLCRRAMPDINFLQDQKAFDSEEYDYHLPLGSLPRLTRNDISDFDRTVKGFLKADPRRVNSIRKELKLQGKTTIGISWKSINSLNQAKKSVQLKDLGRIFAGMDVVLVNLQYGDVEDEIREFKEATGIEVVQCASVDNREDLEGLAALIEVCDLVVSTSNVTIHIAGALAKETWVLVPYVVVNFWWLSERTESIWYPSIKVFRQPVPDDWDSIYVSIRKNLYNKVL